MPVGNPARKFRQRLCLGILQMTLTVTLLCGVQGSNHIMFVLDTYTIQRVILDLDQWTYMTYFYIYTLCPQKQSQKTFCTILFRTDEILYSMEDLFLSLFRTQLQLHFQ